MKILIAYDGSSCADAAVNDLQRAGLPAVAEVRILSVAEVFLPQPSDDPSGSVEPLPAVVQRAHARALQAVEEVRSLAMQARERVLAMFPGWQVQADARADSPAWAVIKEADAWQPHLVVVGSHGRSALGRLVLGSVSHKVLTEVRCSVRVARGRDIAQDAPIRLIIGVDGSAGSVAAVQAMAARSWPDGTEIQLLAALEPRMSIVGSPVPPALAAWVRKDDTDDLAWVPRMVEALTEQLQAPGVTVSSVLKEGDPKRLLIEEAEQWNADTICLGARGLSGVARFVLGSVSTAVAMRAPCSVEVIHHGAEASR
jgi:nucleotide-binding universal stress UspA family protein